MKLSSLFSHSLFVGFAVQFLIAYEWFFAGWEKIASGQFVPNMGKTLLRFETGNPHTWYVHSLLGLAKDSPALFGQLVQWGELLAGIGLIVTLLAYSAAKTSGLRKTATFVALFSLLIGAWMNLNFYFAAGWSNVSTSSLNVLMLWIQLALMAFWTSHLRQESQQP